MGRNPSELTPAASPARPACAAARVPEHGGSSRRGPGLAARVALGRLERLRRGRLQVQLPDGTARTFGPADGTPVAELAVSDWRFFARLLAAGDIGAGESYMDGDWTTPDLVTLTALFIANESDLDPSPLIGLLGRLRDRLLHLRRRNTRAQARRNVHAHYDLGNHFYRLFLDASMTYSAALFEHPDQDLEAAQHRKYQRLAEMAGLLKGDHVLEIGCGWGGFAEYAAGELGCHVTGITLSEQQAQYARQGMRLKGLEDRLDIRVVDYRDLQGTFDAIVSIEMLEAVGHRFLGSFFAACDRLLKPGGRVALQVITIPDQSYDRYRRGTDWIRKYIFPGGHLVSLSAMQDAIARHTSFVIDRVENIGPHYATTLRAWRQRFWTHIEEVRALGFDERFVRMWDFYLATCEAGFAQRKLGDLQLALARPGEGHGRA